MNTLTFCSYLYHNPLFDLVYFCSVKLLLSNIICIFASDVLLILGATFHVVHLNVYFSNIYFRHVCRAQKLPFWNPFCTSLTMLPSNNGGISRIGISQNLSLNSSDACVQMLSQLSAQMSMHNIYVQILTSLKKKSSHNNEKVNN